MIREETVETTAEAAEIYAAEGMGEVCEETVETTAEAAETYAAESMDEATEDDWNGSYEFPSETAASEPSSSEIGWVEDLPEANSGNESSSYGAESDMEQVCPESAASPASTITAEDAATEEALAGRRQR